jgi:hypothetical protein
MIFGGRAVRLPAQAAGMAVVMGTVTVVEGVAVAGAAAV